MTPLGIKFSSGPFLHTWASRRGTRWLKTFLDGLGHERIAWAIQNHRDLTSFFPPEEIHGTALKYPLPKAYVAEFPDDEVYGWIPEEYRAFIEGLPSGREWTFRQISFLRRLVVTT